MKTIAKALQTIARKITGISIEIIPAPKFYLPWMEKTKDDSDPDGSHSVWFGGFGFQGHYWEAD